MAPAVNNLQSKLERTSDGRTRLMLSGTIDENSPLEALFSQLNGDTVLNLQGVQRINSMGVHEWITQVTKLVARHRVEVEEISYPVVLNAIALSNMFAGAAVSSCMAPYACASCKSHVTVVVTRQEVNAASGKAPDKRCAKCMTSMEFEEVEEYFSFMVGG